MNETRPFLLDIGVFNPWFSMRPRNPIASKPVPGWPDRRSYRAHQRSKASRKNGGAR